MFAKTVTNVYVFADGMQRRLYKTRKIPYKYYYLVDNKRIYIDEDILSTEQKLIITTL